MTTEELKRAANGLRAPEGMEARLLDALREAETPEREETRSPRLGRRRRRWAPLCAAAVLALVLGAGALRLAAWRAGSAQSAADRAAATGNSAEESTSYAGEQMLSGGTQDVAADGGTLSETTVPGISGSAVQTASGDVELTLRNDSDGETYTVWSVWTLERETDGTWSVLLQGDGGEEPAALAPGETLTRTIAAADCGTLEAGHYRAGLAVSREEDGVQNSSACGAAEAELIVD